MFHAWLHFFHSVKECAHSMLMYELDDAKSDKNIKHKQVLHSKRETIGDISPHLVVCVVVLAASSDK
jgi:hypothetical protein